MNFLTLYYKTVITHDLINKFQYKSVKQLPKLKKIILYFDFKKTNINSLISSLFVLKLITSKTGSFIKARKFNAALRIKKGNPVGCKIILNDKSMYDLLAKLLIHILGKIKPQQGFFKFRTGMISSITLKIKNIMVFKELEPSYKFLKEISDLHICVVTTTETIYEFLFLLKSLKFPIK